MKDKQTKSGRLRELRESTARKASAQPVLRALEDAVGAPRGTVSDSPEFDFELQVRLEPEPEAPQRKKKGRR